MAKNYELNYDWSRLGPTTWTEDSRVTLQVDIHSYDHGGDVFSAVSQWLGTMDEEGGVVYAGGCHFPQPIRMNEEHLTAWVASSGQDAFDSIAHYAEELREVVEQADAGAEITWTELPHQG